MSCDTSTIKYFLDKCDVSSLDESYVNVNAIIVTGNEWNWDLMKSQTEAIDSSTSLGIQGAKYVEIDIASVDDIGNIGSYATNSNNELLLIVDKGVIDTVEKAEDFVQGMLFEFAIGELELVSNNEDSYDMEIRKNNGMLFQRVKGVGRQELVNTMYTIDSNNDLDSGFVVYTVRKGVKKK